jgi:hypothetical protein
MNKTKTILDVEIDTAIKKLKDKPVLLTGNSGLGVSKFFFHISAPYSSNGKVFIRHTLKDVDGSTYESWKRVDKKKAKEHDIIQCSKCSSPAFILDHHHPYDVEYTLCKEHYDKRHKKDVPG